VIRQRTVIYCCGFSLLFITRYFGGRYSLLGIRYLNRYSGEAWCHPNLNQIRPSWGFMGLWNFWFPFTI